MRKFQKLLLHAGHNLKKKKVSPKGSGLTLTSKEIKDIKKTIRSLEKRGVLLKKTIKNVITQEEEFLNFLRPLMKAGFPLMKSVLTHRIKSILLPLGLATKALATDAPIQKKTFGSSMTMLIFSNEELDDIMKIVKSIE